MCVEFLSPFRKRTATIEADPTHPGQTVKHFYPQFIATEPAATWKVSSFKLSLFDGHNKHLSARVVRQFIVKQNRPICTVTSNLFS